MKTIHNSFGRVDEIEMIEQFCDIHGRKVAENLDRIYRNHYYSKDWTIFAKRDGYSDEQIRDFQQIQ